MFGEMMVFEDFRIGLWALCHSLIKESGLVNNI